MSEQDRDEGAEWHIEPTDPRSYEAGCFPGTTLWRATLFEGGIPSRVFTAMLREDLDWLIADHRKAAKAEKLVEALTLPPAIVSLLTSAEIQAHPFPWKGHHQPWPDGASRPEKVIDRRAGHPFSGNWKEVCASIELAWRCINYVSNVPDALAEWAEVAGPEGDEDAG